MQKCEIVARINRGEREESVHFGAVAVVDAAGNLTHYVGDPDFFTFTRSSAKPFQLIPLIRTGAADNYGFSDKQLAVMCGSHSGTADHAQTVQTNLAAAGNKESDLLCGAHPPIHFTTENRLPRAEDKFTPIQHNCSGKHSGFLALSRFLGEPPQTYLEPSGNVQQMVLDAIAECYRYPKDNIILGTDGCSAPNFGMPLRQTAVAFAALANLCSERLETRKAFERIRKAMTTHPEMVSGEGRFDLALARTFPGRVVNKVGAEGIEGIGFTNPSIGIAAKILDGNARALYPVCVEVLRQLGLLATVDLNHLQPFTNPEVRNYRNLLTGRIVAEFELHHA